MARPPYRAVRRTIGRARLSRAGPHAKIVVGAASIRAQSGWVPTDIEFLDIRSEDDWSRYFNPDSVAAILAEHVWEHLDSTDARVAARNCFRFLEPGGYLRAAVPDGLHPDPTYIEWVRPGGTGPGADDHRVLHTYRSFGELFESEGFDVRLLEYFDEAHQFRSTEWDPAGGFILRSSRNDPRNQSSPLAYTSIVLDAYKP
jgi:predicted SAM-dependent methyltransferase